MQSNPIPQALIDAFAAHPYLPLDETARLLRMAEPTLREHVRSGDISSVQIGKGTLRKRRMFRLSDVLQFLERQSIAASCPSAVSPRARSSGTTLVTKANGFAALRNARKSERQKHLSVVSASA